MTQLPTVVVAPEAEFGKITTSLFRGISGILDAATQDVRREGAQTQAENDIALAQQRTLEIEAKVDVMRQRLVNKDMEIKYRETIELERMGLIKILADSTPQEALQFLRKYRFIDPQNRSRVMAQHGRTLAIIDIEDAQKTIIEFFSRPDANPDEISAEGLMDAAIEKRGGLPPEAKLAYQGTFLGQAKSMVLGQVISSGNKRQTAAVIAARRDRAGVLNQWLIGAGDTTWDDVLVEQETLRAVSDVPLSERDFSNAVGQAFLDVMGNFEDRPEVLQAMFEGLPPEIKERLPRFGGESGILQKTAREAAKIRLNAERVRLAGYLRQLDMEGGVGAYETALIMVDDADPALAVDPGIVSMLNRIENQVSDERDLIAHGLTIEEANGSKDMFRNFNTVYNAPESVATLRAIVRSKGRSNALNRLTVADNYFVAELIAFADTDEEAMRIATLFNLPSLRSQLGTWKKLAGDKVNAAIATGDLGAGINLPGNDPDLKSGFASFQKLQRDMVIKMAEERSDPNAEVRSVEDMVDAIHKGEVIKIAATHASVNGIAVSSKLTGLTAGVEIDDDHPFMDMLGSLKATSDLTGGTNPALLQMFRHVDGFTYIPAVDSAGRGAFGKWDPNKRERGREVMAAENPELFAALNHQLTQEYPDALRIQNSDLAWHKGMPSPYIGTVDDMLFPGAQARGYWHGGLKPKFHEFYFQETGQAPPDFDNPPIEDPDATEGELALHAEGKRVYNLLLGRWLPDHGYQARLYDPNIPRLQQKKQAVTPDA